MVFNSARVLLWQCKHGKNDIVIQEPFPSVVKKYFGKANAGFCSRRDLK